MTPSRSGCRARRRVASASCSGHPGRARRVEQQHGVVGHALVGLAPLEGVAHDRRHRRVVAGELGRAEEGRLAPEAAGDRCDLLGVGRDDAPRDRGRQLGGADAVHDEGEPEEPADVLARQALRAAPSGDDGEHARGVGVGHGASSGRSAVVATSASVAGGPGRVAEAHGRDAVGQRGRRTARESLVRRGRRPQVERGAGLRAHDDVAVEVVLEDLLHHLAAGGRVPHAGSHDVPLDDAVGGADDETARGRARDVVEPRRHVEPARAPQQGRRLVGVDVEWALGRHARTEQDRWAEEHCGVVDLVDEVAQHAALVGTRGVGLAVVAIGSPVGQPRLRPHVRRAALLEPADEPAHVPEGGVRPQRGGHPDRRPAGVLLQRRGRPRRSGRPASRRAPRRRRRRAPRGRR